MLYLSLRTLSVTDVLYRETERVQEKEQLLASGKIPHNVELEKHPEKSIEGMTCQYLSYTHDISFSPRSFPGLMGKVAGAINDVKPAKEM